MDKERGKGIILGNIGYLVFMAPLAFANGVGLGLAAIASLAVLDWLLWSGEGSEGGLGMRKEVAGGSGQ